MAWCVASDESPAALHGFAPLPTRCSSMKEQEGCLTADWPAATFKGESFSEIHSYLYQLNQKKKNKWTTLVKQLDRSCKHTSSWTNWWEKCSVVQNVTLQVLITPPCKPQTPISRWLFTTTWSTRADHNVYKSDYYGPSTALVLLSFKHGRVWRCFWPVLYFCNKAVVCKPKSESCSTWGGQAD